jgi:hypothetical protein
MQSIGSPLMWALFATFVAVALLVDFLAMSKQGAHRVSTREAALWSLVWVGVSFAFMGWMWWHLGGAGADEAARALANDKSLEFLTGYQIEKALAVDNIFVFLMLFTYFAVPAEFQKRVLMIGILGALVLRAVMILVGAWLIAQFHWILYVFRAFLLFIGAKMLLIDVYKIPVVFSLGFTAATLASTSDDDPVAQGPAQGHARRRLSVWSQEAGPAGIGAAGFNEPRAAGPTRALPLHTGVAQRR